MELHQLEYFVAVAEEGSFTRAAERMHVAQPSLSQQIKKLERELGQPLFDRLPRQSVLTEAGQRLLEHARRVLAELADARRHVREVRDEMVGRLAVGAIPTMAPYLMPPLVAAFRKQWPQVELFLVEDVTERLVDSLRRGEIDLAVVSDTDRVRGILTEHLADEALWLLAPKGHPLAKKRKVAWNQLVDQPFLVLDEMHCLSGQVLDTCRPHGVKPAVVSRGVQLATIAGMVSAGLGLSMVPEMMRRDEAGHQAETRVYKPLAGAQPKRAIMVATNVARYRSNAARAFLEMLRAAVKK